MDVAVACLTALLPIWATAFEPLPAKEIFPRLLREALFVGDPGDCGERASRFGAAARLAAAVPAASLTVPEGLDRLASALADIAAPFGGRANAEFARA